MNKYSTLGSFLRRKKYKWSLRVCLHAWWFSKRYRDTLSSTLKAMPSKSWKAISAFTIANTFCKEKSFQNILWIYTVLFARNRIVNERSWAQIRRWHSGKNWQIKQQHLIKNRWHVSAAHKWSIYDVNQTCVKSCRQSSCVLNLCVKL